MLRIKMCIDEKKLSFFSSGYNFKGSESSPIWIDQ